MLRSSRNSSRVANASWPSKVQAGSSAHFTDRRKRGGSGTVCGHRGCKERSPDLLYTHINKNNAKRAESCLGWSDTFVLTDKGRGFHFC